MAGCEAGCGTETHLNRLGLPPLWLCVCVLQRWNVRSYESTTDNKEIYNTKHIKIIINCYNKQVSGQMGASGGASDGWLRGQCERVTTPTQFRWCSSPLGWTPCPRRRALAPWWRPVAPGGPGWSVTPTSLAARRSQKSFLWECRIFRQTVEVV